ncbi:hypothetical protein PF002_g33494 [Phytophthora fragariae]|uniref:Uncharacterized protein n=1 Tax=Phytophthora fragariae TaxID=53985 RepID=A0A6A3GQT0_9STRA|nr:hypothetical protein PF009_g33323 [Phytophthora fragariae]KAE8956428.1 hypothetical protein PF011_g31483 [Phytophthora fragariae]KAE9058495.1 hypothetical protein PF006_g32135 [Phytophthora fragariae]KAE9156909.1 hypothetical protein PF002_g33494 [Phytophthora fragariae]KAE9160155.1 hypothetical protein PF004_g31280 [Phytophthora fragariae]
MPPTCRVLLLMVAADGSPMRDFCYAADLPSVAADGCCRRRSHERLLLCRRLAKCCHALLLPNVAAGGGPMGDLCHAADLPSVAADGCCRRRSQEGSLPCRRLKPGRPRRMQWHSRTPP